MHELRIQSPIQCCLRDIYEEKYLPVSERVRLWELPHPAHSENLDQAVRVQSSLQVIRHPLIWGGTGPAHRRQSVMLADSPLSSTQLIPANIEESNNVIPITHIKDHITIIRGVLHFPTYFLNGFLARISLIEGHIYLHGLIEQQMGGAGVFSSLC